MSGKVNNALYELIHSMTKSEKRYFKLMSSRHTIGEENNYVRLFDFLDRESNYNEEDIHVHFKGEAFLNRFSITKKRMYDQIISALDSFHSTHSTEAQLYRQIHSADILFEKSLYDQCRRVLNSAEKLARKSELHAVLQLISRKRKRLFETNGYLTVSEKQILLMEEDDKRTNKASLDFNRLWNIKSKLFSQLSQKGIARSEEEVEGYKELCSELLKESGEYHDFETNYLYHHTLSAFHYAINDLPASYKALQENLNLIESHPLGAKCDVNKHISILTNAIYIGDKIGFSKDSLRLLGQLKSVAAGVDSNEDLKIKLFSSIASIEISMFLRKGDFVSAKKIVMSVEEELEKYDDKIVPSRRAFLEFKLAVVHMGLGDYQQALRWINRILNDSRLDKTEDIIGFTQLLDLLVHIELGNVKLLPYSFKNTQRFFKTRNRLYSFEKVLLQFINKLIKSEDLFERKNLWESLHNELAAITDDDLFESVALDYFDFQSWAESKLKGKSYEIIVREKYNRTVRTAC